MTACVPGFEYDVFISYAQLDDHDDWVKTLKQELQKRVNSKIAHKSNENFFFDTSHIDPNASLKDTIRDAVRSAAILVVVLSDSYCDSQWCQEEREQFIQKAGGIEAATGRIFVIRHSALGTDLGGEAQLQARPEELRDFLGVQFYEVDTELNVPETFATDGKQFAKWLNYLRFQLAKQLRLMRDKANLNVPLLEPDAGQDNGEAAVVYLAEPTFKLFPAYAKLQTFLEQHRPPIRVIPGHIQFSNAPDGYEDDVSAHLAQCDLFVQLLGAEPFPAHTAFQDGYERWLLDAAGRHKKEVLRWRQAESETTGSVIAERNDLVNGEVITAPIEEFMKLVAKKSQDLLRARVHRQQKEKERRSPTTADGDSKFVLVKAEKSDLPGAYQLADLLVQRQIGVDPVNGEMTVAHAATGTVYDAVLLYYGDCSPDWLHQAQREFRNLLVEKRQKAPAHLIIHKAPPLHNKQLHTRLAGLHVVEGDHAVASARIVQLLQGQGGRRMKTLVQNPDVVLPYPGLRPFQQQEHEIFFGRGKLVIEMLTRLEDHRFLAVVGASGSGKSSLVRAGLLPRLEEGLLLGAGKIG